LNESQTAQDRKLIFDRRNRAKKLAQQEKDAEREAKLARIEEEKTEIWLRSWEERIAKVCLVSSACDINFCIFLYAMSSVSHVWDRYHYSFLYFATELLITHAPTYMFVFLYRWGVSGESAATSHWYNRKHPTT